MSEAAANTVGRVGSTAPAGRPRTPKGQSRAPGGAGEVSDCAGEEGATAFTGGTREPSPRRRRRRAAEGKPDRCTVRGPAAPGQVGELLGLADERPARTGSVESSAIDDRASTAPRIERVPGVPADAGGRVSATLLRLSKAPSGRPDVEVDRVDRGTSLGSVSVSTERLHMGLHRPPPPRFEGAPASCARRRSRCAGPACRRLLRDELHRHSEPQPREILARSRSGAQCAARIRRRRVRRRPTMARSPRKADLVSSVPISRSSRASARAPAPSRS